MLDVQQRRADQPRVNRADFHQQLFFRRRELVVFAQQRPDARIITAARHALDAQKRHVALNRLFQLKADAPRHRAEHFEVKRSFFVSHRSAALHRREKHQPQ